MACGGGPRLAVQERWAESLRRTNPEYFLGNDYWFADTGGCHNNACDAVIHCAVNCWETRNCGARCAKYLADRHEQGYWLGKGGVVWESVMDCHNNAVGRALGGRGGDCLDLCARKLAEGQLKVWSGPRRNMRGPDAGWWIIQRPYDSAVQMWGGWQSEIEGLYGMAEI